LESNHAVCVAAVKTRGRVASERLPNLAGKPSHAGRSSAMLRPLGACLHASLATYATYPLRATLLGLRSHQDLSACLRRSYRRHVPPESACLQAFLSLVLAHAAACVLVLVPAALPPTRVAMMSSCHASIQNQILNQEELSFSQRKRKHRGARAQSRALAQDLKI
jgi:hypothetical protein